MRLRLSVGYLVMYVNKIIISHVGRGLVRKLIPVIIFGL